MFVTETTALLAHPPATVVRTLRSPRTLVRWCRGLRPGVHPTAAQGSGAQGARAQDAGAHDISASDACDGFLPAAGYRLRYVVSREVTLPLVARSSMHPVVASGMPGHETDRVIVHLAHGDGVTLTWTFVVRAERGAGHTRLVARTALSMEPGHPAAAHRAAIARLIARRAPGDLVRLTALLARRERRTPRSSTTGSSDAVPAHHSTTF